MSCGDPQTLLAALLAGLLGSGHCLAMCGGIAAAGALPGAGTGRTLGRLLVYNGGRLASYALAGGLAGSVGLGLGYALNTADWAGVLRLATGLVILAVGAQIAFGWRLLAPVEALGARFWRQLAPLARPLLPRRDLPAALALGLLWGWLPCGLVYGMLLAAVTSGGASEGASVMLAFGLGTLPAMVATGAAAGHMRALLARPGLRTSAGVLVMGLGVWTMAGPSLVQSLTGHMH